jgi:hypothetical protein
MPHHPCPRVRWGLEDDGWGCSTGHVCGASTLGSAQQTSYMEHGIVLAASAEMRSSLFSLMSHSFQAAGLLDTSPQREGGLQGERDPPALPHLPSVNDSLSCIPWGWKICFDV